MDVETGQATTWINKTRKTEDFIKFMNKVVRAYPGERLCVIMDNLNTHKGRAAEAWLAEHPNVTFHYTPTHASWVNLAECFFSIVSKKALDQAVHHSGRELEKALDGFMKRYNEKAGPFVWTKGPEKLKNIIGLTKDYQQSLDA